VVRWRLDGRLYYCKRYLHRNRIWRPVKYWFKKPRSRQEWALSERLGKAGVPVVPHLAHGECWTWWGLAESVVVTEAPPGAQPLGATDLDCPAFQRQFGSFIRNLHERGVKHRDPNAGNFLYSAELSSIFLVDLDKIEIQERPLSAADRLENLALLWAVFPRLGSSFFETFGNESLQLEALRARAVERRKLLHRQEAERCLPPRHYQGFRPNHRAGIRWWVRETGEDDSLQAILETPDSCFEEPRALCKNSRSSTVGREDGYVIKRYNLGRPWKWAKANLRGSYARRAFRSAYHLELAGIPGARPVAFGDRRRFGLVTRSYVVTQEIPGARPLDRPAQAELCEVARLMACLHEEGFRQLDPKPSNIVMDPAGRAYLVDMDGIRFLTRVPEEKSRADIERLLGRLSLPPGDQVLFMRAYWHARNQTGDWDPNGQTRTDTD